VQFNKLKLIAADAPGERCQTNGISEERRLAYIYTKWTINGMRNVWPSWVQSARSSALLYCLSITI